MDIRREGEKILISIDKDLISSKNLLKFIDRLKLEEIAKQSKLTKKDVAEISEKIKEEWWQKNKSRFLKDID